ncbi:MAG: YkvA family protein [Candidatus Dormibacteria bacterium]
MDLPQQLRLAYCLARDPRTPAAPKAALAGALAIILNPVVDIPLWVPVLGQMDTIALTLLAVRTFNSQVPEELRADIEAQIRQRVSVFDRDLSMGVTAANRLSRMARHLSNFRSGRPAVVGTKAPAPWYRSPESEDGGLSDAEVRIPSHPSFEESSS